MKLFKSKDYVLCFMSIKVMGKVQALKKYLNTRGDSDSKNTILCKTINNLFAVIDFSIRILFVLFVTFNRMLDMSCLSLQTHSPSFPALL